MQAELLEHYLNNTVETKKINLEEAEKESSHIEHALMEGYKTIEDTARKAVNQGYEKGSIVIGIKGYQAPRGTNWGYALGHFDLAHVATFELSPNSGLISISVDSHLQDTYDFDPDDDIGGVSPYRLHKTGLARNFVVYGELNKDYTILASSISLIP